ncbi:predicted protein [Sclerotinia sclerotiorum 1980 UF-70]|uniref:Uncharacterized protein n=2 Tax=Sclerotinia sclerotiorum (strain ATCC 18683 / 1980 / Ss-1) TaxID=665079 RepID=A7EMH5_SCLS1|nr:predicted protein [Sclerotinia sclerotiorum 1980 UF-70]EDO04041.1 predicted protein [Sclerotinia sclerotiorum 1980 UF-70]
MSCLKFYPKSHEIAKRKWSKTMPKKALNTCFVSNQSAETIKSGFCLVNLVLYSSHFGFILNETIDWSMCPDHAENAQAADPHNFLLKKGIRTLGVELSLGVSDKVTMNLLGESEEEGNSEEFEEDILEVFGEEDIF